MDPDFIPAMRERVWQAGDVILYDTMFAQKRAGVVTKVENHVLEIVTCLKSGELHSYQLYPGQLEYVATLGNLGQYEDLTGYLSY